MTGVYWWDPWHTIYSNIHGSVMGSCLNHRKKSWFSRGCHGDGDAFRRMINNDRMEMDHMGCDEYRWIIRSSQHHWWCLGVWKSHEITPFFFLHPGCIGCWFLSTRFRSLNSLQTSISVFIHDVIVFHAGTSDTHPQLASASHWWPVAGLRNTRPLVLTPSWQKSFSTIWVWINTYFSPFLVGWTSINPSYFDVNYRGTIGFDTLPFDLFLWWFSRPLPAWVLASEPLQFKGVIHSIAKKSGALPRECEASCFLMQLGRCIMPWFGRVFYHPGPGRRPTVSPAGRWLFFRGLLPHWEVSAGEAIRQFAKRI